LDRVFLDANVLFSAAYAADNRFLELWQQGNIRLLSSQYAVQEVRRNLMGLERLERFERLIGAMTIVPDPAEESLPEMPQRVNLPEKDRPILAAAIHARATHLLTGDRRHFGRCLGERIRGVLIQLPAQYLRSKSKPR
jgi:uncharacterized protein